MPPWFFDLFRVISLGTSSGWFGLACPAHCSWSLTVSVAVFTAGFSWGALFVLCLLFLYLHFGLFGLFPQDSPSRTVTQLRLAAYLHERGANSAHRAGQGH